MRVALSDRGVYTPTVVVETAETENTATPGQRAAPSERQPVSAVESTRRKAWGEQWGAHAREDAARRARES